MVMDEGGSQRALRDMLDEEVPPPKKAVIDDDDDEGDNELVLRIDLTKYPSWVRKLDCGEWLAILEMGIYVKQTATITMSDMGLQKEFEKAAEPLKRQLNALEKKVQDAVTAPLQKQVEDTVAKPLQDLSARLGMTAHMKGRVVENQVHAILKTKFPNFTIRDTSKEKAKGDLMIETARGHHLLIEIKNYTSGNVPQTEINKFLRDVENDPQIHVGLFLSMAGGIAHKMKSGSRLQVEWKEPRHLIYVSSVAEDETLLLWAVWLADELAALQSHMEGGLDPSQQSRLDAMYQKMLEQKQRYKTVQATLKSMETHMATLHQDVGLLLQEWETIPKQIRSILNK